MSRSDGMDASMVSIRSSRDEGFFAVGRIETAIIELTSLKPVDMSAALVYIWLWSS